MSKTEQETCNVYTCDLCLYTGRSIEGIGTDLTLSFSKGQDAGSFMGAVCMCVCVRVRERDGQ